MWSSNLFCCIQLFPAFFIVQVFQNPDFSGSGFFWIQVFQGPGFSGSKFFRLRVQVIGPGLRSSLFLILGKSFCEKSKHTELALNFIKKQ